MGDRSAQRAGRQSQQIQVAGDLNVGVSATEAMNIARYVAQEVAAAFTAEALDQANARIDEFDRKLVDLLATEKKLDAMREPAFQILMKKAQRGAAASGRDSDYERLSHLLSARAHEEDRRKRAATDLAVQVVDLVDDDALAGLTAARTFLLTWTLNGQIGQGLDQYERWAQALATLPLPDGDDWIEHLESLGLVRTSRSEHFNPSSIVLQGMFQGYLCVGMDETPDRQASLTAALEEAGIVLPLIPHELHPGHVRFAISGDPSIGNIAQANPASIPDVETFKRIAREFTGYGIADQTVNEAFLREFDARPTLAELRRWWDAPKVGFRFTPPGMFLATANSTRLMRQAGMPFLT